MKNITIIVDHNPFYTEFKEVNEECNPVLNDLLKLYDYDTTYKYPELLQGFECHFPRRLGETISSVNELLSDEDDKSVTIVTYSEVVVRTVQLYCAKNKISANIVEILNDGITREIKIKTNGVLSEPTSYDFLSHNDNLAFELLQYSIGS